MNTYVEVMDVEEGYPKKADPVENCDHDETLNPLGPHKCQSNSECTGARTCSEWGWCQGDSFCDEEEEDDTTPDPTPDPTPDMCMIDERWNDMGPGMCLDHSQCKGDRVCSGEYWYCVGYSNCEDDKEEEKEDKCAINERFNPWGPHECTHSLHCKGDRQCGTNGQCQGASNCPDDEMTPAEKCKIDEFANWNGAHTCSSDNECKGERKCGTDGMCYGYCGCP